MKTLIMTLTLVASLNLFANEEKYTTCTPSDTDQLNSVVSSGQGSINDIILNLLRTRDAKECSVARPVYYFPTVCGASNFTKVLYKFKTVRGVYDITILQNSVSCHGITSPMRVTSFKFEVR